MRPLRALALLAVPSLLALGSCKRTSNELPATLPEVTLPADEVEAGRALGKAAATEKDPAKLAATIVAFLDRLHVPVVSQKGDKLLAKGPLSSPPTGPWFWEPSIVGVARATAAGDARPFAQVMAAFVPKVDPTRVRRLDFAGFANDLAGAHTPLRVFSPIAAAIVEDLQERKQLRAQPALDPVATMLLGLLLYAEKTADGPALAAAATASAPTSAPQRPAPFVPPGLPGVPGFPGLPPHTPPRTGTVHALGFSGGGGAAGPSGNAGCRLLSQTIGGPLAAPGMTTGLSGLSTAQEKNVALGGGLLPPDVAAFLNAIAGPLKEIADLAGNVGDAITGMGIAAFFDATGDVTPKKVTYGDGPARFKVTATSANPLSKDELDTLAACFGVDAIAKIPPKGPVSGVPVWWTGTGQYVPKYGTFTPDGTPATSQTDSKGEADATFQVKPKKSDTKSSKGKTFTTIAEVFPFPVDTSKVNAASNALFNRSIPIGLEIDVPNEWTLTVTWGANAQSSLEAYFTDGGSATVTFKPDPNDLSIHAKGTGYHLYQMPPQQMSFGPGGGAMCFARGSNTPVEIDVDGRVTDSTESQAELHIKIVPQSPTQQMTVECVGGGGKSVHRPTTAIVGADLASGTKLEEFTIGLDDGTSTDFPIDKQAGPLHVTGTANVSVESGVPAP